MKKVLITGLTGMVGSHLADFLLENTNWEINGMCRWRSPLENINHLIPEINKGGRIKLNYADLRDLVGIMDVLKKIRPDFIFHLAAQSYPQVSFTSPLDTFDTNIQGTARLLEAAKQHCPNAVIHICASSEIFGRVSQEKLPINEECSKHILDLEHSFLDYIEVYAQ